MSDAHQKRKLSWFIGGTKRQPARPVTPKFDPGEDEIARQVQDEVVRQFEQARDASRIKLDLRAKFRGWGNALVRDLAAQIGRAKPKKTPDGTPTGGSLAKGLKPMLRLKRWGFVLSAGSRAGVRFAVTGMKRAEQLLADVATQRLRAEHGAQGMEREMARTSQDARALERAAREERRAARGRP